MTTNEGFWTDGIYGTADRLNASLLQLGTLGNRPAAGQEGRMYMLTDTASKGVIYRDTGIAWEEVLGVDLAAGTASLRTLGTDGVKAAAGNHGHSFADLTATTDDTDVLAGAGASNPSGTLLDQIASAQTHLTDLTHDPTTDVALVAVATIIVQGLTADIDARIFLYIDGVEVDSVAEAVVFGIPSIVQLSGMRQKTSGSYVIRASILNNDGSNVLLGMSYVQAFSISVS